MPFSSRSPGERIGHRGPVVKLTVAAVAVVCCLAMPAGASAACGNFIQQAKGSDRNVGYTPGQGAAQVYTASIASYVQRCGKGRVRARHQVYFDTRSFPYGKTFTFSLTSRRSDGQWRAYKDDGAFLFALKGKQKIQEVILYQTRFVPRGMRLTRVHVKHCGCSFTNFDSAPIGSTLKAVYKRYAGPEARPGS